MNEAETGSQPFAAPIKERFTGHGAGACIHGPSYNSGLRDADEMVGALWSDLFNKDMVKSSGADTFGKWRSRIRGLEAGEPRFTDLERQLISAVEQIATVIKDNDYPATDKTMVLKFVREVAEAAVAKSNALPHQRS